MSDAKDKRAEHSPAPWSIDADRDVNDAAGCVVAHVQWTTIKRRDQDAEHEANARLIAAAPALLAELRAVVGVALDCQQRWSRGHAEIVERARKALALVDGDG